MESEFSSFMDNGRDHTEANNDDTCDDDARSVSGVNDDSDEVMHATEERELVEDTNANNRCLEMVRKPFPNVLQVEQP